MPYHSTLHGWFWCTTHSYVKTHAYPILSSRTSTWMKLPRPRFCLMVANMYSRSSLVKHSMSSLWQLMSCYGEVCTAENNQAHSHGGEGHMYPQTTLNYFSTLTLCRMLQPAKKNPPLYFSHQAIASGRKNCHIACTYPPATTWPNDTMMLFLYGWAQSTHYLEDLTIPPPPPPAIQTQVIDAL